MSALEQRLLSAKSNYHVGHQVAFVWSRNKSISSKNVCRNSPIMPAPSSMCLVARPIRSLVGSITGLAWHLEAAIYMGRMEQLKVCADNDPKVVAAFP